MAAVTAALWNRGSPSRMRAIEIGAGDKLRAPRIGLALSGGGAKSAAHIGVLQALIEANIRIDLVAGTSGGAMAGLFFCDGHTPEQMEQILKSELMVGRFWRWVPGGRYWQLSRMLKHGGLRKMLQRHIRSRVFADLKLPLFATATDLLSGERVVLQNGEVISAVMASMSLPGFSPPVVHQGRSLVDGGVLHYIPADVLRENGADVVIGVDLGGCNAPSDEWRQWSPRTGAMHVLRRAWAIQNRELSRRQLDEVDVVIRPRIDGFGIADLLKMDRLIERGRDAGARAIPFVIRALEEWQTRQRRKRNRFSAVG